MRVRENTEITILSVCLLLKNACMDLDEMLRVDANKAINKLTTVNL